MLGVAALLVSTSGCLDPYRPQVAADVLERTSLAWVADERAQLSAGLGGAKTIETDYVHEGQGSGSLQGYPAILQTLGVRGLASVSNDVLLRIAQQAVDNATSDKHIRIDRAQDQTGSRRLASGLETQFFVQEGTVTSSGVLFSTDAKVRIVGEVGHDGVSSTSFVLIGIAQIDSITQCPLPLGCTSGREDLRSWAEMVGDPSGSVKGAVSDTGLIHNLVTHD